MAVDTLSILWQKHLLYMFLPLENLYLDKIMDEKVNAVMIAPLWENQVWYPTLAPRVILESLPFFLPDSYYTGQPS